MLKAWELDQLGKPLMYPSMERPAFTNFVLVLQWQWWWFPQLWSNPEH